MEENCHLPAMCPKKKNRHNKKGNNGAIKTENRLQNSTRRHCMFAQGVKDLYEIVNFSVIINQLTTHFLYHRSIKLLYFIIWTPCNCSKVSKIFAEVYTVSAYETLTALLKKKKNTMTICFACLIFQYTDMTYMCKVNENKIVAFTSSFPLPHFGPVGHHVVFIPFLVLLQ